MASLQAKSPLRSTPLLLLINKLIALTAFVVLLCAGWVAVSYVRAQLSGRWRNQAPEQHQVTSASADATSMQLLASEKQQPRGLSVPVRLVYSCGSDRDYFHTSTHLAARCERSALSEEAALQRGLKPCPVCIHQAASSH